MRRRYSVGMGNREDLLAGARQAILEKGVAGATARDIANAAGVSLAAIGYHFGSKDQLITEALTEGLGVDIGDAMEALMRKAGQERAMPEAFAATWNGMRELLQRNREGMLLSLENGLRVARSPQSQHYMTEAIGGAYTDIGATLRELHPELSQEQAYAIAQCYFVLVQGMAVLLLLGPEMELPDGDALATAVAALAPK